MIIAIAPFSSLGNLVMFSHFGPQNISMVQLEVRKQVLRASGTSPHRRRGDALYGDSQQPGWVWLRLCATAPAPRSAIQIWKEKMPFERSGKNEGTGKSFKSTLESKGPNFKNVILLNTLSSVQFSRSVMSDSLRPHESQHARPHCPSPTPGVHSNSCPSSQ